MLSLPKHLYRGSNLLHSTMRARCFGKLSMTCWFTLRYLINHPIPCAE